MAPMSKPRYPSSSGAPQSNPLFPRPRPSVKEDPKKKEADQKIEFNDDDTVTVTKNGLTNRYSKKDYNNFLRNQTGEGTPQAGSKQSEIDRIQSQYDPATGKANALKNTLAGLQNVGDISIEDGKGDALASYGGAAVAGTVAGIGAAIGSGAKIGAVAGTVAGPGAGNVVGGVVGGIVGAAVFLGKISLDKRQNVKEGFRNYNNAVKGMRFAQNLANEGRTEEAKAIWMEQKRNLYISQAQLKEQTRTAVGRQLSNGMEEYNTVNDYIDTYLNAEEISFAFALANPDPSKVIPIRGDSPNEQV